jgi:hypothetical protein
MQSRPDFYLASKEGYGLDQVRSCWRVKQLKIDQGAEAILVRAEPPVLGERRSRDATDGIPEQQFKDAVAERLAQFPGVSAAYLARVEYQDEHDIGVALCIRANANVSRIADEIARLFQGMFAADNRLDIIFLDAVAEQNVRAVCRSFCEA